MHCAGVGPPALCRQAGMAVPAGGASRRFERFGSKASFCLREAMLQAGLHQGHSLLRLHRILDRLVHLHCLDQLDLPLALTRS